MTVPDPTSPAAELARPRPPLAEQRVARPPRVLDTTLASGLRVLAVKRPGAPLVELRLRVPFAGPGGKRQRVHAARVQLLTDTLLSGTADRDAARLAQDLQALGGQLSTAADGDRLAFAGSVLSDRLDGLLALLADVLTGATYPSGEVAGERERLVQELAIHRSQPSVVAREALLQRMHPGHAYALDLPLAEDVAAVKPGQLRDLHSARIGPQGSTLVLVGDLDPARATAAVEAALGGWDRGGRPAEVGSLPPHEPGPALLIDRPGAVQTTLRLGAPAPARTHEDAPALTLANLVFGGYFSSRWVANIREDKGYTYSPHSGVEHLSAGSRLVAGADVSTPTTAAAVLETWYELGRLATLPVEQEELDQARRYYVGSLALSTASQAGLANQLSALVGAGLGLDWLQSLPGRLQAVTVDDVLDAAQRYLAPSRMTTVLVGDRAVVEGPLSGVLALEP